MATQYNIATYGNLINTNGVLSNFSTSNYATLPINNNLANDNFEVVIKFNISLNSNDSQILWCVFDSSTVYPLYSMCIDAHKLYFETTTGTAQILEIVGSSTISLNTDYYARLIRNNNTYTLSLSTDGSVWTTEGSSTNSNYPTYADAVHYLGVYTYNDGGTQTFEQVLDGEIDLNSSYITLDNTPIWKGVTNITRIQLRHDTAANWTSVNPILLEGEVGIETDTLKQKVGDGVTAWNSLSYMGSNEIFVAEYGTTTYQEVLDAYNAGKTIFFNFGIDTNLGYLYHYSGSTFDFVAFSQSGSNKDIVFFTLSQNNGWDNGTTKTIVNDNLSNVTIISSNSAVQTALDSKVNKSGDTMTGTLTIQDGQCLIATDYDKGSAPSTTTWNSLEFVGTNNSTAWQDKRLGIVELTSNTDSSSSLGLRCYQNATSSTNYSGLTLNMSSSGVASCTFPNTTCVDGQFVSLYQEAVGSTAYSLAKSTSHAWTFSNLPAKNCLVWVTYKCSTNQDVAIYSDLLTGTNMRATGTASSQVACVVIPVSSSKKIYLSNLSTSTAVSISFFRIFGYRVLGSNVNT